MIGKRTLFSVVVSLAGACIASAGDGEIFNGRNLDGWYAFTVQKGRENPGIFTVVDGMLRISGGAGDEAYYGGLVTEREFSDFRLTFEYRWSGPTYGKRKDKARDSGVLLHAIGPNEPGPWMISYEFQIIEGGTGDILVVNPGKKDSDGRPVQLKLLGEGFADGKQRYFKAGGDPLEFIDGGRLNWWGRDPAWKDAIGYRGPRDVESPLGEWTRCEILARGDTIEYHVNGELVNRARGLTVTRGKLLFQTEGAEIWYRNIRLEPLAGVQGRL